MLPGKASRSSSVAGFAAGLLFVASGAVSSESHRLSSELVIEDFESGVVPSYISVLNGSAGIVPSGEGAPGNSALNVRLKSKDNNRSALILEPGKAWDWSGHADFHIAFDVSNHGAESVQIDITMSDQNEDSYTRGFAVPVGPARTYYAKLDGHDQSDPTGASDTEFNFESGLRSNPVTWVSDDRQVYSFWGKKQLDRRGITQIVFAVEGSLSDREFTIDNIRLRPNPAMDPNFLVGLLDEFGQSAKAEYDGKVRSGEHLVALKVAEMESLSGEAMPDRSKYSGWKDGPRFEATGNFRAQKINGKWWLIDPEGYLYFSTGIDIIRLSNLSTITGYDFDRSTIQKRSAEDTVAEDDQPLNRVSEEAQKTRFLVSEVRAKMFNWLPDYDSELGNHYGYRRETQSGPLKHGETYSFYSANLERRYGETYPESYLDTWQKVTIDRMLDWGFTSLGNWAIESYYVNERIPFVAFADIIGDFGTLSSGFDFWHPVPDPYDPKFYERAVVAAEFVASQVKNSPWCMGVFFDNEQSFGRLESDELHYGIVISALRSAADKVHAKARFTEILQGKYETIEALNQAWNKNISSWQDFADGMDSSLETEQQKQDYADLLYAYGNQYFGTANNALKSVLPNHLYLGSRFPVWGMPPEIVRAAARHVDVITYNLYEEGLVPEKWAFLSEIDRPSLIGEFSFGADDAGHFHPGIVISADQEDRGRMFRNYLYSVIDNPYFVGAHMFQYVDSPITGRAYDGENYNNGFLAVTDVPYEPMVKAAKEVNSTLYQRRFGEPGDHAVNSK